MAQDAYTQVENAAEGADQFVSARFLEAQTYAANAWDEANSYLSQLVTTVTHPAIDTTVSVPLNYTGGDIVIASHGEKPGKPVFDTDFPFNRPALGTLKALPSFDLLTSDLVTLRSDIITRLLEFIEVGSTGLSAEAEQAIFDRARGRQEIDNARLYTEAEEYFAARGFEMPTGALSAKLQEINIEIARRTSDLNNDIMTEQAKLAQTNFQFALEKGATIVTNMIELSFKSVIDYNKGTIDAFLGQVEEYKQEINSVLAEVEAKSKVYLAEAEVYKANAAVDNADIVAQVEIAKLSLGEAQVKAELAIKEVDIELEAALKLHQLQVAAYESGSKVTAQIVASALSAVNASANYGFSGSASIGGSYSTSYDATKGVATHSYSQVESI